MTSKLWNYLRGYVIISIEGFNLERVINRAAKLGLWSVKRESYTRLTACARLGAYRELRSYESIRVTLIKKSGVPVWFLPLRGRTAFFIGAALFMALVLSGGLFVWDISILGADKVSVAEITVMLEEYGIKRWAFIPDLEFKEVETRLMLEPDIAWASVKADGVEIKVEVVEAERKQVRVPGDIIAREDAIIRKMTVVNGTAMVSEGDAVKAGQVLISGMVHRAGGVIMVPAEGDIIASVFSGASESLPLTYTETAKTGNVYQKSSISLFGWQPEFLKDDSEPPFENYVSNTITRQLFGERMLLPVYHIADIYDEVTLSVKTYPEQQLKERLKTAALEKAAAGLPKDAVIIRREVTYENEEGTLKATAIIEAELNIARTQAYAAGEDGD